MLDPVLSLALAVYNSKGVYALLLGSGVSKSAGIPTGWDVIIDLINKLRLLNDQSESSEESEAWYRTEFNREPDYSEILDDITKTPAERLQLLRSYFEPTEQEREDGVKLPSAAHRAIASLIAKGYIRVVVTTNFDRLLEDALRDVSVQPTIISTVDAITGATPLVHSACTIVKVHGDYLDVRLKNTASELGSYPTELDSLLDRIFDEYGLIVCGWSGEWDIALRAAFERCNTHRYGTYWAVRGKLGKPAEKLVGLRRASVIEIQDADSLFQGLQQKVEALADFSLTDPVSPRVAVAQAKRLVRSPEDRIRLHDFVVAETERAFVGVQKVSASLAHVVPNPQSGLQTLRRYEAELSTLLPVCVCMGAWSTQETYELIGKTIKRFGDNYKPQSGYTVWLGANRYPALLLLYGTSLSAVANHNYGLLAFLFQLNLKPDQYTPEQLLPAFLNPFRMWNLDEQKGMIEGRQTEHTPLNNHLFEGLQSVLREYIAGIDAYEQTFDWFEYVLALIHCEQTFDAQPQLGTNEAGVQIRWGPPGRFIWKSQSSDNSIRNRMTIPPPGEQQPIPKAIAAAVSSGLCRNSNGSLDAALYEAVKAGFYAFVGLVRWEMRLYF